MSLCWFCHVAAQMKRWLLSFFSVTRWPDLVDFQNNKPDWCSYVFTFYEYFMILLAWQRLFLCLWSKAFIYFPIQINKYFSVSYRTFIRNPLESCLASSSGISLSLHYDLPLTTCIKTIIHYPDYLDTFELRHEKTCLQGLRPVKTQTGLLSYID